MIDSSFLAGKEEKELKLFFRNRVEVLLAAAQL